MSLDLPSELALRYEALRSGKLADGTGARIALAISSTEPDHEDAPTVAGLGGALVDLGFGVSLVPADQWHRSGPADLWVALVPEADPSGAPEGSWRVAWVRNDKQRWLAAAHLPAFDQIVAGSPDAGELLRLLSDRVSGLLPAPSGSDWADCATRFAELVETGKSELAGLSAAPRTALHFYPDYRSGNAYQSSLYSALAEVGAYPVAGTKVDVLLQQRAESTSGPGVLHIHWTAPIMQNATGPFGARRALDQFIAGVERFKARGGRLLWTVHNVLPHDGRFEWDEIRLAQYLADESDLIHVLSDATFTQTAPYYRLDPAKVVVIDIASYLGIYPDDISREDARRSLGLHPQEKVLISLGGVRPYKGLGRLLDIFAVMAEQDPTLRLLIAGQPGYSAEVQDLVSRASGMPRVLARFEHLPDDELQVWMNAADVAVLPYHNILNSSAVQLAHTFGLPVVVPRAGALASLEGAPHAVHFEPSDEVSLRAAIQQALRDFVETPGGSGPARRSSSAAARAWTPSDMAGRFAQMVRPLLDA